MTIVEFLTARLDEDEALAVAATPGPWKWEDLGGRQKQALVSRVGNGQMIVASQVPDVYPSVFNARFMERYHPASALADIAAKRRLLALAEDEDRYPCTECSGSGFTIVHALASVYADHPDFNQEWRL